mmetsp:Transcript_24681/g.55816  ORF Transcript_24681/g.55816 Transcript_24681/m.55816 type:complete len:594 (-) Transcript_24681:863-2644(-)
MLSLLMAEEVINAQASNQAAGVVGLVLLCTLFANFLQRFNTSYWFSSDSVLAIVIGFIASVPLCTISGSSSSTTRPGKDFDTVFFLYLVPSILYESGYSLNQKDFFRNFTAIILYAVLGTVISSIVTGMTLFQLASKGTVTGINASSPKESLMFGSLLSATDPVATLAVLGQLNVDPQLYSIIFGESVLNDAVAIVLFQTLDSFPDDSKFHVSAKAAFGALGMFLGISIGSVLLGTAAGLCAGFITKWMLVKATPPTEVTVMLSMAYISFIAADSVGLSGLMAVFFSGIVMSHYAKYNISEDGQHTTHNVTRTLAHLSEMLTFLYFGYTILPLVIESCARAERMEDVAVIEWSLFFWTLFMCFVSRAINVVPLTLVINILQRNERRKRISIKSMLMIWFSGLRGAIAFALSLTFQSPNRRFLIPCVILVVLFTNFFLGQATAPLLKLLRIPIGITPEDEEEQEEPRTGIDLQDMSARFVRSSHGAVRVGKIHALWRRVDELYLKPYVGGRSRRGLYRRQAGLEETPSSMHLPHSELTSSDLDRESAADKSLGDQELMPMSKEKEEDESGRARIVLDRSVDTLHEPLNPGAHGP